MPVSDDSSAPANWLPIPQRGLFNLTIRMYTVEESTHVSAHRIPSVRKSTESSNLSRRFMVKVN
jgi:hypothetical protein